MKNNKCRQKPHLRQKFWNFWPEKKISGFVLLYINFCVTHELSLSANLPYYPRAICVETWNIFISYKFHHSINSRGRCTTERLTSFVHFLYIRTTEASSTGFSFFFFSLSAFSEQNSNDAKAVWTLEKLFRRRALYTSVYSHIVSFSKVVYLESLKTAWNLTQWERRQLEAVLDLYIQFRETGLPVLISESPLPHSPCRRYRSPPRLELGKEKQFGISYRRFNENQRPTLKNSTPKE